ncbi:MAG TPA: substrate-binding domain-containing protein [Streptosporangiaceae bacterium]
MKKLLVAATAAAAITALTATPALADPPTGVTPKARDVVGVGADAIQYVFDQFAHDYNATHTSGKLYSFYATNPTTGAIGDPIQLKASTPSSTCNIPRPDGSNAGISALENTKLDGTSGRPCIDFARSSRARASTDPSTISFINLAGDAVTYATQPASNAPANLTTADLTGIYNCSITKWNQIPGNSGGSSATISAFIPQSGSGTRSFFLGALGLTNPGSCVSTSATRAGAAGASDNTLQESQGDAPILNTNNANVIVPFGVGKYLAERFRSASCGTVAQCYADPTHCTPVSGQNLFGCNIHGTMVLDSINGTAPTTPFPPTKSSTVNVGFTPTFTRLLYEVVNSAAGTIPAYLKPYFGPTGFTCNSATATTDLKHYGFVPLPKGTGPGDCGFAQ